MRLRAFVVTAALVVALAVAVAGSASGASGCKTLKTSPALGAALMRANHHEGGPIAFGSLHYGSCGATSYAIASFVRARDLRPVKFRRLSGQGWVKQSGGDFEVGCTASGRKPIPAALVRLWRLCPILDR